MSENEKTLRQEIHETRQNAQAGETWLHVRLSKMTDALDALLAEHRTEVERLTAEVEKLNKAVQWTCNEGAEKVVAAARDAALEEVAQAAHAKTNEFVWTQWNEFEEMVRALKSRPAEATLPESKVREVLDWATDLLTRQGYGAGIVRDITKRLNLDAPPTLSARVATSQAKTAGHKCQACWGQPHNPTSGVCSCPCADCIAFRQAKMEDEVCECGHGRLCHLPGNCNACCTCREFRTVSP